jgi:hypothetical protein
MYSCFEKEQNVTMMLSKILTKSDWQNGNKNCKSQKLNEKLKMENTQAIMNKEFENIMSKMYTMSRKTLTKSEWQNGNKPKIERK